MEYNNNQSDIRTDYSTLAGPLSKVKEFGYSVKYRNLRKSDNKLYSIWTLLISIGAFAILTGFLYVLFQPNHWIINQQPWSEVYIANLIMLICLALLQVLVLIGTISSTRATMLMRDPVPVEPPSDLNIAFATTRAPGEPVEMVRKTLAAAKDIETCGNRVDVWLLDETDDQELFDMCMDMGVGYFSRKDVNRFNTSRSNAAGNKPVLSKPRAILKFFGKEPVEHPAESDPFFAAKSKHGNFNSWIKSLKEGGVSYDILAGVDTDQVPSPNYLKRTLGYFNDQDVAFVVGPQVYGNYGTGLKNLVARWAESQASFFQSTIQRAANATNSAMFVGTNYAVRMKVLEQINGFQPCITEDMATGLAIHTKKNPATNNKWKSVYTPDILAIGEGPDLWGPFFTQQWRWAAGTFDTWRKVVWKIFYKLSPAALLHYLLILTYYPIAALTWFLSVISSVVYLLTGATAVQAPWGYFVSLYSMVVILQLSLYFWNRRFNVSPHEPVGSYGISGMIASTVMAPVYFSALVGIIIGKKANFVVTKKGESNDYDSPAAFKTHLKWAGFLAMCVLSGFYFGNDHPAMMIWGVFLLFIVLLPVGLGSARFLASKVENFQPSLFELLSRKEQHDV